MKLKQYTLEFSFKALEVNQYLISSVDYVFNF